MDAMMIRALFLAFIWFIPAKANGVEDCQSPQYAEIGMQATIQCSFNTNFYGVYWYTSTDTLNDDPVLLFERSKKSGAGYETGEFDVHPNGSLIINYVTLAHDHEFSVLKLNSRTDHPNPLIVRVVTTVRPEIPHPRINHCETNERVCAASLQSNSELSCLANDVRPAINLQWMRRSNNGDTRIHSHQQNVSNGRFLYNSSSTAVDFLKNTSLLELLVCRAIPPPLVFENWESLIIVQKVRTDLLSSKPMPMYVELHSKMKLSCNESHAGFLIWEKVGSDGDSFEDIAFGVFLEENFVKVNVQGISLGHGGSLIVPNVDVKHEGMYSCVFSNGITDGIALYDVLVYAYPEPGHLVVAGCENDRYCDIDAGTRGTVECFIKRIRPEVELEWRVPYESSIRLSFYNQQTKIKTNEDTFDVSITADYIAESITENSRVTIECRVVGSYSSLFNLVSEVELVFTKGMELSTQHPRQATTAVTVSSIQAGWIILFIIVPIIVLTLVIVIIIFRVYRKKTSKIPNLDHEEKFPMFEDKNIDPETSAKKQTFINQLKGKYEDLYYSVQPIPYIRERNYRVDNVYVGGGIEIFFPEEGKDKRVAWKRIDSYHNIFIDPRIQSTRKIIQGDAGYGKTTFTLQLAYDWCNGTEKSPMINVDILILLRLRQMGKVNSIYRAIKHFILPRDSQLTEDDIENIIQSCKPSSILVVLDGFDEYQTKQLTTETDIIHIIRREMFQDIPVIMTTRTSSIPEDSAPNTKRIRLTGFDDIARDTYIRKVVVGADDESAKKIKHRLDDNPVLADVCQVPLFFVMFAHMTHERDEFLQFNSVTSFFRYMIRCFHAHLYIKNQGKKPNSSFENDHSKLDKEALYSLSGDTKRTCWRRKELITRIGQDCYNHYINVGILVEEEVVDFGDETESTSSQCLPYRKDVRFYHNLFCEWYAAHALSDLAADCLTPYLRQILATMDPFELHYVYRFACGLSSDAAENILRYLDGVEDSEKFSVLCILEKKGKVDNIKDMVVKLCSDTIIVSDEDSQLKQRSIIQLLEIASSNAITISSVTIENCVKSVDLKTWKLNLKSGMYFSNLSSVQEISVSEMGRNLTETEAVDIITFCFQCLELQCLRFDCCWLPRFIKVKRSPSDINKRNIKVTWIPTASWYRLNLDSGVWEFQLDGISKPISDDLYQSELLKFQGEWSDASKNT
ncbi:NACHT, LRR and PYD domains-containing protein 14 [Holothuria leucospilota]|uniref:NACHT, LRR and PYD domains-containing protein 14 n=1 Tax=Holothuria leucospilota TaxID=206669 RepID=A0A9Q1BXB7_HOLLE|nr:NACHT, LRR and PYD domains-containing protein 14 [Holothuria leucospilota]